MGLGRLRLDSGSKSVIAIEQCDSIDPRPALLVSSQAFYAAAQPKLLLNSMIQVSCIYT